MGQHKKDFGCANVLGCTVKPHGHARWDAL